MREREKNPGLFGIVIGLLALLTLLPSLCGDTEPTNVDVREDPSIVQERRISLIVDRMIRADQISPALGDHVRTIFHQQREMVELFAKYGLLTPAGLENKRQQIAEAIHLQTLTLLTEEQKIWWEEWDGRVVARPLSGRLVVYSRPRRRISTR